ncbi:MAG: hypothetical protein MOB07_09595 [Acidobacteria bacterium]|nr:hypothetical protein [Acidobacteriota bacterium]
MVDPDLMSAYRKLGTDDPAEISQLIRDSDKRYKKSATPEEVDASAKAFAKVKKLTPAEGEALGKILPERTYAPVKPDYQGEGTYSRAIQDMDRVLGESQLEANMRGVMNFFDEMSAMDPPTAKAPKVVADAEGRLREIAAGKRAGSGAQAMADMALVGGYRVYRAGIKFADWAAEVIRILGEKVRPFLQDTWNKVRSGAREFVRDERGEAMAGPGPSRQTEAMTRYRLDDISKSPEELSAAIGRKLSTDEIGDLVGAPSGAQLRMQSGTDRKGRTAIKVSVFDKKVGNQKREIAVDETGKLVIYNDQLQKSPSTPAGFMSRVLDQQIDSASRLGVDRIEAFAAGGPGKIYNGYYTLPRLGFDGPLKPAVMAQAPRNLRDAKTIQELFSRQGGPEWWKKNGRPIEVSLSIEEAARMKAARDAQKPDFVTAAEQRLSEYAAGTRSGSGGQQMADVTVAAGYRLYRAGMRFGEWASDMVTVVGERVRPYLRQAWNRIQTEAVRFYREQEGSAVASPGPSKTAGQQRLPNVPTTKGKDDLTPFESLGRKIGTTQTAAQLLNTTTLAANAIGNAAFAGVKNAAAYAALPIDKLLSLRTGQRQVSAPQLRNQVRDFADGFADVYAAVRTGDYKSLMDDRYDLVNERVFKNKVGKFAEDVLNIALRGPDRGGYLSAYNDAVGQILAGQAKSKTKISLDKLHEQAKLEAQQSVFQDKNLLSNTMTGLREALNNVGFGKKGNFGLGDLVGLKYARTPANLLARGIEYSPLNLPNAIYKVGKVLITGNADGFAQRQAALAFGKTLAGTATGAGLGVLLRAMGIIAPTPEREDRGVAAAERAEGLGGYQLNLSALKRYATGGLLEGNFDSGKLQAGDKLVTYDWFQPLAFGWGMGAATFDAYKGQKDNASMVDTVLEQVDAITSTLTDQSILRNIRDIARYGLAATGRKILTDTPASFVPAVLNQARKVIDDRAREIPRGEGAKGISREALDKVLNRLPVASKRLPEKTDVIGRPVPSRLEGAAGAALVPLPGRFGEYRPSAVLTEMQRLDTGSTGVRRKEDETEGQFRARRARAQEWLNSYGTQLVTSQAYRSSPRVQQQKALEALRKRISLESSERRPDLSAFKPSVILSSAKESLERERVKARNQAGVLQ